MTCNYGDRNPRLRTKITPSCSNEVYQLAKDILRSTPLADVREDLHDIAGAYHLSYDRVKQELLDSLKQVLELDKLEM